MPNYRPARLKRYDSLIRWGFLPFEAREYSGQYASLRVSYIQNMARARRLYVSNLRSRGLTDKDIVTKIRNLYKNRNWLDAGGAADPWKQLKRFRKVAIADKEYNPKRGKHHGFGISKGDIKAQKSRKRGRVALSQSEQGRLQALIRQRDEARENGDNFTVFRLNDAIDELRRENTRYD